MEKLKIGVIGTGVMGKNHVRNLAQESRFDLVGIFDTNQAEANKVAELYGTTVYENVDELLKSIDAVVIAAPSTLHKELALKAAEYGVNSLVEKPLATNSEDAREIAEVFKNKKLKLMVGHIERFNPVMLELSKIVANKKVFYVEAHRYSPFSGSGRITDTSVIEDLMIHDVDLVCDLMKSSPVKSVSGFGEKVKSSRCDFGTCVLQFENNTHAVVNASRVSQNKERVIYVHTEDACICADLLSKSLTISQNTDLVLDAGNEGAYRQNGVVQKVFVPIQEPLKAELFALYDAVMDNKEILVNGVVATKAIEICEKVVKMIETV